MRSRSNRRSWYGAAILAPCVAVIAALAGCGHAKSGIAPSALVGNSSNYDGQTVTVSGTVKGAGTAEGRRGMMTRYQLCDNDCINVVQFGNAKVSDGSQLTLTGRFHAASAGGPSAGGASAGATDSGMSANPSEDSSGRSGRGHHRRHHRRAGVNVLVVESQ
jgi:hypothetical protein